MGKRMNAFMVGAAVGYAAAVLPQALEMTDGRIKIDPEKVKDAGRRTFDAARDTVRGVTDHDDLVDEMSEESFPSSDPPSTWAGADRPRMAR